MPRLLSQSGRFVVHIIESLSLASSGGPPGTTPARGARSYSPTADSSARLARCAALKSAARRDRQKPREIASGRVGSDAPPHPGPGAATTYPTKSTIVWRQFLGWHIRIRRCRTGNWRMLQSRFGPPRKSGGIQRPFVPPLVRGVLHPTSEPNNQP
ncbi:hypothetical protein T484DRAFT_1627453 [Baffinella frigidus]|nr:hypothetical protein T484DRAFT_1627453 [Cryptophyta sp. CCMP2293]